MKSLDPLYNFECEKLDNSSDELLFFRLAKKQELSYSLEKGFLNDKDALRVLKIYNDWYHETHNDNVFLGFCTEKTIFTNLNKKYITFDNVIKQIKELNLK